MRTLRFVAGVLVLAGLAGCAGSVAPPTVVTAFPTDQRAGLHLAGVTTETAPGVALTAADISRITQLVMSDIQALAPGLIDPATGQELAKYKVAKQFSFGGLYGGLTSIQDVEKGFSKSVAALVKP